MYIFTCTYIYSEISAYVHELDKIWDCIYGLFYVKQMEFDIFSLANMLLFYVHNIAQIELHVIMSCECKNL